MKLIDSFKHAVTLNRVDKSVSPTLPNECTSLNFLILTSLMLFSFVRLVSLDFFPSYEDAWYFQKQ